MCWQKKTLEVNPGNNKEEILLKGYHKKLMNTSLKLNKFVIQLTEECLNE